MDNNVFNMGAFCVMNDHDDDSGILAMAFVNPQPLTEVYDPDKAFCNGTLFPNLNKPFLAGGRK